MGREAFRDIRRYANALKAKLRLAQRIGAALGFADVADPLPPADGLPLLADAESRRATEWESVLLVGDAATIAAARRWHETIWTIELLIREGPVDAEKWTKVHRLASAARDASYQRARRDLGINGAPPLSGSGPGNGGLKCPGECFRGRPRLADELGVPLEGRKLRVREHKIMGENGLRRVRLYDARASCLTYLADNGVPDHLLAMWAPACVKACSAPTGVQGASVGR